MNKLWRKVLTAGICTCMAATALTGCAPKADKTAVTVGDEKVNLGLVNLMLRINQAQMQTYYGAYMGEDMWANYGETTKDSVVENIENMILMEQHMDEYGESITDDEKKKISDAAKAFIESNDEKTVKAMNATTENVERFLTLYTVQSKMYDAIVADVDREVSDEEAAQKTVQYVLFSTAGSTDEEGNSVEMSDEDKAAKRELAEKLLEAVKGGQDMAEALKELGEDRSPVSSSFGTDNGTISDALREAAEGLSDGEVADSLVETDGGYYVLQMVTTFDEEKTEAQKDTIVSERINTLYTDTLNGWKEDTAISTDSDLLATLSFVDTYELKVDETEAETSDAGESENAATETAQSEAGATEAAESESEAGTTEAAESESEAGATETVESESETETTEAAKRT